jgi:hypothetical protein
MTKRWFVALSLIFVVGTRSAIAVAPDEAEQPAAEMEEVVQKEVSTASRVDRKDSLIRAAIFVQNNGKSELDDSVAMFRDVLSARLADKGFSILDAQDIVARFRATRAEDSSVSEAIRTVSKVTQLEKTESSVEQVLDGSSALRIAQMIDAHYLIVATLSSIGEERRRFDGSGTLYKTSNEIVVRTLRATIRVLEGNQGGSVYGDVVTVSKKYGGPSRLSITSDETNNGLIDEAAETIAKNISQRIHKIRDAKVETESMVELTVNSNVEGATLEIDNAVVGTAPGRISVRPGLHQIAVSKEWYSTWRRTVNVVPNQVLQVTLERSVEGAARHAEALRVAREDENARKDAEALRDIAKEQSAADAFAKKAVAEGERDFRKNSHTQIEGPVNNLTIEPRPDAVVKVERE